MWSNLSNVIRSTLVRVDVAREDGQALVEYALILALVSIALILTLTNLATAIGNVFTTIIGAL